MRILIIGGTLFIGPAVVRRLHERGHAITLFHRGNTENEELPDVPHMHGDRNQLAEHAVAFRQLAPDVVLDMRPLTEQDARSVVDTFRDVAGRVVAISSMDVYRAFARLNAVEPGPPDPVPLTEDAPLREQLYPYRGVVDRLGDYDKILVERIVLGDHALSGTVLRLPFVYGPRDNQHRLAYYLKRMDDQRPAIAIEAAFAGWRSSRGYVDNVAEAIALAVTNVRAAGRTYNVADQDVLSERAWIEAIGRAAGWRGQVVVVPPAQQEAPFGWWQGIVSEQDMVADTSRIRAELGYTDPIALPLALEQAVAWERAHAKQDAPPDPFDYAAEDAVLARAMA